MTVRKIERAAQDNFPTRTQVKLEQSLGWPQGAVRRMLTAHDTDQWGDAGSRSAFIQELVTAETVEHPAPAPRPSDGVVAPLVKAAHLSDEELLAELTYRMKRYADRA